MFFKIKDRICTWAGGVCVAYLLVCMQVSQAERINPDQELVLIPAAAQWRYQPGTETTSQCWKELSFNDADWKSGKAGFGYGDDDDRTQLPSMKGEFDSLRIRHRFTVNDPDSVAQLFLYVRFDDAFIAYLNGMEIARSGVTQDALGNMVTSHEANRYELFTIDGSDKILVDGENVLAVEGFNRSLKSSDFTIEPVLATNKLNNPGLPPILTQSQWLSDLDEFERRLEDQSSYIWLEKFDYKKAIRQLKNKYKDTLSGLDFARELQKLIVQIGDAHAKIKVNLDSEQERYLPFVLADTSAGVMALSSDQSRLLEAEFPIVKSIDGKPLSRWLKAAEKFVPQASDQLIRYQSLRQMRSIDRLRTELALMISDSVKVTLQSLDGKKQKTLSLKTEASRLPSGKINFNQSGIIGGNIGYLRIPSMYDGVDEVLEAMTGFKQTAGLIIDVRGNRGGHYDILRALYGYFVRQDSLPYVANIAAYRLSSEFEQDHLHYRPTYRHDYKGWNKTQLAAIDKSQSEFEPMWTLPEEKFSDWHYMLLGKSPQFNQYYYEQPAVVLSDAASFSATDGFLSAFSDLPQVKLIGQASSGGSGATQHFRLFHSGIEVALSSMASFRPNGTLYDGSGVQVDIEVMPEAEDFLGTGDAALEKAVHEIEQLVNQDNN